MMGIDVEMANFVASVLGAICGGIGTYAGIKANLAKLNAVQEMHSASIARAHERIDNLR